MKIPIELKKRYLERKIQDIEELIRSLDNNDFSLAQTLGHQVKGNALTFGMPQLAGLGISMEKAAKNRDKESLENLIQRMTDEINMASRQYFQ